MNWETVLGIVAGNAAFFIPLFLWNRTESRADYRMVVSMIDSIQKEIKDFHGSLCAIEEKRGKKEG